MSVRITKYFLIPSLYTYCILYVFHMYHTLSFYYLCFTELGDLFEIKCSLLIWLNLHVLVHPFGDFNFCSTSSS